MTMNNRTGCAIFAFLLARGIAELHTQLLQLVAPRLVRRL